MATRTEPLEGLEEKAKRFEDDARALKEKTSQDDHERAEKALRQSEARKAAMLESALDCVITINHLGCILEFNPAAEKTFGYARTDVIGRELAEAIIPPSLRERHRRGLAHYLATGEGPVLGNRIEMSARRADGTEFPVELAITRIALEGPPLFTAYLRDISERKTAEARVRASEERYRLLFENNPQPMWIYDTGSLAFVAVNETAVRLYGYSREEFLAMKITDIRPAEDVPALLDNVARASSKSFQTGEWRHRKKDGTIFDVEIISHGLPFGSENARLVTVNDVTERKRRESIEGSVKHFEEVQRATLNILEDFDAEKRGMERVQSATLNLLEDFDAEKKRLEDVQRATINILDDFNFEKTRSEQSQRALLNILDDMDVEKSKVASANQQLETVNKELEIFSYSVSHDLRAPLRHIDGFSKMLVEEYGEGLPEEARRYLTRIREGTQRMGQLVDDLLNLGRVGRKELSLQVTGLGSLANEVVAELKRDQHDRAVEWKLRPLPFVECDPALMKQVFVNLLSNALKYTRPRARAMIEVGAAAQNGQPAVFVRDNGVGFSMKYATKLFGVFQRLHRTEDFEGTGVGLATVQRIIHKHGGRVWAEAELDRGATFYFTLGGLETIQEEKRAA